ncbi:MAG: hypothetical protein OEM84_15145, partial [Acidimicrobiia bacterium]|nr:hypothetical protein [Acidimicrobiia bacterium]
GDINRAVIAGLDGDLRLRILEHAIVSGADASRAGRWLRPITHFSMTTTIDQPIAYNGSTWRPADQHDADATMSLGPSAQGALVLVKLADSHRLPIGRPIAQQAATAFTLADIIWDTRIGDLTPGTASLV